jgi:hypothetical protein
MLLFFFNKTVKIHFRGAYSKRIFVSSKRSEEVMVCCSGFDTLIRIPFHEIIYTGNRRVANEQRAFFI